MAFTEAVVEQAWKRAGVKCECRRWTHNHGVLRCNQELVFVNRGPEREGRQGRWEPHRVNHKGDDTLSNCEILCWDCYKRCLYE